MINIDNQIQEWARLCENEDVTSMINEDMDDETIVGMFQTDENMVSKMGEVGTIKEPHFYTVSVRSNGGA